MGKTSSLHTILVSLPEIRAAIIQTGVPSLQLSSGDTELHLYLAAVVTLDDGVVLLARGDGVGVQLGAGGRGRGSGSRGCSGSAAGSRDGLGGLDSCDGSDGRDDGAGSGRGGSGSGRRGLRQDGGHASGVGGGGGGSTARAARRGATTPVGASEGADGVVVAAASAGGPAEQTVGDIRGVAVSCDTSAEVTTRRDGARVVAASSLVVGRGIASAAVGLDELQQTVTVGGTHGTITDHLLDLGLGAGVLNVLGGADTSVAAALAVVRLHETGVDDAVVGGVDTDTAVALLHDDSQDEAGIDAGLAGDLVDGGLHGGHLGLGGIGHTPLGAGRSHDLLVGLEHVVKAGDPARKGGPSIGDEAGATEDGGVEVAATSTEGVAGRGLVDFNYICRGARVRVCDWSPRNEGEAASSQKEWKSEVHRD